MISENRPPQIRGDHLRRLAIVYVRQSTPRQVDEHTGSTAHQRGQKEYPLKWGWVESNILVIEEDLGLSGSSGEHRRGWHLLLKLVAQGRAGIILTSDTSRLTRSSADFETLLGLCLEFDTLLAVEGVIVDPTDSANRLLARLRANVVQYENELRTETFMKGRRAKAQAGHAVSRPPTGYVVAEKGKWVKDPDMAVQQQTEEVFRQFQGLGTVGRVLRFFVRNGLLLPIRTTTGELRWVRPTRGRIYKMLTDPAFAGFYVFGRRPFEHRSQRSGQKRRRTTWEDWIKVPGHHEPYISPAEWFGIQDRLRQNRLTNRQPPGAGPALLQGIVTCGKCGRHLMTHYSPNVGGRMTISYMCTGGYLHYGLPPCWRVPGNKLDEVVAVELLRALTPPAVDAVLEAAAEVNHGYDAARRQQEAELARARYQARLAEKRYKEIDPENHLVADTLAKQWNLALETLERLERRFAEEPLRPPLQVTPEVVEAIRSFAKDLPGLWAATSTTDQDRKALIRLFVREVVVISACKTEFAVQVKWVGGPVTHHAIVRPGGGGIVARQLEAQGLNKSQIAEELNRLGYRTLVRKEPYTPSAVRNLFDSIEWRTRKLERGEGGRTSATPSGRTTSKEGGP